jgi:hypothetical protein
MMEKRKRLFLSYRHQFKSPCKEIFQLLCPVREDDWIPGWREQRRLVYSESGLAELGCVFITTGQPHLMGPATWVNNVYKPFEEIQYSAVNEHLVYQIGFELKSFDSGCDVVMTRRWTALTQDAENFLGKMESAVLQKPPDLFSLMDHFLATGKMRQT